MAISSMLDNAQLIRQRLIEPFELLERTLRELGEINAARAAIEAKRMEAAHALASLTKEFQEVTVQLTAAKAELQSAKAELQSLEALRVAEREIRSKHAAFLVSIGAHRPSTSSSGGTRGSDV